MREFLQIILILILFATSAISQIRLEDGEYHSPRIGMKSLIYKFHADTFETDEGGCLGSIYIKGLYKIIDNKISFYPLNSDLFLASKFKYTKGKKAFQNQFTKPTNTFIFHFIRYGKAKIRETGVWLIDNSGASVMTLFTSGDTLILHPFQINSIRRIRVGQTYTDSEEINIDFDNDFIGEHIFNVNIYNNKKLYGDEENYTLPIVNITSKGFTILYQGEDVELRKIEFIDDDFRNSRRAKIH